MTQKKVLQGGTPKRRRGSMNQQNNMMGSFIKEAQAHLDTIESDLRDIKDGSTNFDNFDMDTCNNVYRHVQTIKGAAGFYQLERIQSLAGKMSELLSMIRYKERNFEPQMAEALIAGTQTLKSMFEDVAGSGQIEIRKELDLLDKYIFQEADHEKTIKIEDANRKDKDAIVFEVPQKKVEFLLTRGNTFYTLEFLLKEDLGEKNVSPYKLINGINWNGEFIESKLDIDKVTGLDNCLESNLPLIILFATQVEFSSISEALDIPADRISKIDTQELEKKLGIIKEDPDTLYLTPDSDLVASEIESIRDDFLKKIRENPDVSGVVLKVDHVENMDSLGVNLVIGIFRQMTAESKEFKVTGAGQRFMKVAKFFQFPALFTIEPRE
jgi:chemotaxis protein histidine kinase CheA